MFRFSTFGRPRRALCVARRFRSIKLSLLADAFNYGPKNIEVSGEKVTGLFGVDSLKEPFGFREALDSCYSDCHYLLFEAKDCRRRRKMVQVLDDLSDTLCRSADLADCVRTLHPDKSYRNAASEVCLRVGNLVESLNTDTELYQAAAQAARSDLSTSATDSPEKHSNEVDKRVLGLFVEDFEQSGVHLEQGSDRDSFLKAVSENMEKSIQFGQAANSPFVLSNQLLRSISPEVNWGNLNELQLFGPIYNTPQNFLRALTFALFYGPIPGQEECLTEMLNSRNNMAISAGMDSYLRRAIQPSSLAESPERAKAFLEKLASLLSPVAKDIALNCLLPLLPYGSPEAPITWSAGPSQGKRLHPWDIPYLIECGRHQQAIQKLRPFFSLGACMEGVNQLADSLFGLRLQAEPALPGEVWHPDVVKVAVYTTEAQVPTDDDGEVHPWERTYPIGPGVQIGTVYCDFFDRPDKPVQDCHYTVRGGRHTEDTMFESNSPYQFPIVVLHLNLGPSPSGREDSTPPLLHPNQIENLFHEWGHALHSMVARTRYQHVTGTRCSTDLAEVPSTLLEHFALDTRVTCQYARHFDTGEAPSSADDVRALLRLSTSRAFGQSVEVLQHLTHAMMDQRMHSGPPDKVLPARPDVNGTPPSARLLSGIVQEYCDEWLAADEAPDFLTGKPIATTHRFGHLAGYGGRYYSYLMARAGAGLIWQKGFAADPWSTTFGRRYRDCLLRHGGERRPAFMLKRLLGDSTDADHGPSLSPDALATGLFEDVAACEETAKRMFEMDNQPGLKRIL
ncbi:hypothetical protein AAHC03_014039 [Spirometra sp. Aus1]